MADLDLFTHNSLIISLKGGEKASLLEFTLKNILLPSFNVKWTYICITGRVFVLYSILDCATTVHSGIKCKYSALFFVLLCLIFVPVVIKINYQSNPNDDHTNRTFICHLYFT